MSCRQRSRNKICFRNLLNVEFHPFCSPEFIFSSVTFQMTACIILSMRSDSYQFGLSRLISKSFKYNNIFVVVDYHFAFIHSYRYACMVYVSIDFRNYLNTNAVIITSILCIYTYSRRFSNFDVENTRCQ